MPSSNFPEKLLNFETIFRVTASAYLMLDPALIIVDVNDAYLRATSRTRDSVVGRHVFDAFPPNPSDPDGINIEKLRDSFNRVLAKRTPEQINLRYDIPMGVGETGPFAERYWSPVNTPLLNEHGEVTHIVHHAIDVTDRVLSQDALRESERRFRALVNATGDVIYRMNPDWTYMYPLDGRGFVQDTDALAEYHIEQYVAEVDLDIARNAIAAAIRDKAIFSLEHRVMRTDGSIGWTYSQAVPIFEKDESIIEWIGYASDITARKIAEEELKNSHRRKDEFLAMLAHELRDPLAPISSAASLLQLSCPDDGRILKTSQVIKRQVEHMTNLVDDLLDVSRVTRGLVDLEKLPVDIRHIVVEAVEQITPLVQARRHNLTVRLQPDTTTVLGDKERLVQVLTNLLNNAAKYTPEGGEILVKAQVEDANVVLQVIDNDIGMAEDLVPHAFELFSQAERSSDRSTGGLGLGLALVKNLVELHGGTTACKSAGLGSGTTFSIHLPRVATVSVPIANPAFPTQYLSSSPLRILVVDDNIDAAEMLGMMLTELAHTVTVLHDPHSALDRGDLQSFDVLILDIGLPDMDGHELARRLRMKTSAKSIFIAATGYGQESDRARTGSAGFSYHFVKPIDMHELTEVLATAKRIEGVR